MVSLNAEKIDHEDDLKGRQKPKPGRYHVAINAWDERCERKPTNAVFVEFQVLAGDVPGEEGKTIEERFFITEKAIDRLVKLAICANLLKPGQSLDRDLTKEAVGRQLVIEIVPNKYQDKEEKWVETVQVDYLGLWSLNHEEVAAVPKNAGAVKLWEKKMGELGFSTAVIKAKDEAKKNERPPSSSTAPAEFDDV